MARRIGNDRKFQCDKCGREITSKIGFISHLRTNMRKLNSGLAIVENCLAIIIITRAKGDHLLSRITHKW